MRAEVASGRAACAVSWCSLVPTRGRFCAIHDNYPELRTPKPPADDEVIDTSRCPQCSGSGQVDCGCQCGDMHTRDCDACYGTGKRAKR